MCMKYAFLHHWPCLDEIMLRTSLFGRVSSNSVHGSVLFHAHVHEHFTVICFCHLGGFFCSKSGSVRLIKNICSFLFLHSYDKWKHTPGVWKQWFSELQEWNSRWKSPFVSITSAKTQASQILFYLILPPWALGSSCPVTTFSGASIKVKLWLFGGVQLPLCFRVVKALFLN